ncbi:MAG TPA: proton-conducting transporter membrane subunit, partial [Patescibacteria group bacterium]|nr:proton-conducting transporter membrane subunit [Patescibacteria group bacterium]
PEVLICVLAVLVLVAGRMGWISGSSRRYLPGVAVAVALVALAFELTAGATLNTYFGGSLVQDRFALFAKLAVLLAVTIGLATADWTAEESPAIGVAMPLLATLGVMVVASAGDLFALWAGLELAAAAGVVMVSLRRPELALRLLVTGGLASTLTLLGFAFLYASTGGAGLQAMRGALAGAQVTLPLAIPILLLLSGLAVRAGAAPFLGAAQPAGQGASPLGSGLLLGLVAAGSVTVALKLTAAILPVAATYSVFLQIIAAVTMLGGGAAALAARSARARIVFLAAGQVGWLLAGMATHYRAGTGASLFLLGAFAVAATCGPAAVGRGEGTDQALMGLGSLRPARAAGLALAMLSLAGAPPLAGFFGDLAVAAALAQGGHFVLIALGLAGSALSTAAAIGTVRLMYLQSPIEEARRGASAALPAASLLASAGSFALGLVMVAYGLLGNPIFGLADQGAKALGLR